ncbi:hypothetical protein M419DRAFT_87451 [Trichoderma reesei RUT C-30]|uniref:Uncharacterized protein n=1 Tax=Hypocrea jecorina (strain ATCC 56765 / BCRC 32924 / NRRL 11460 / Rut C-30) TaxID=1344414 RepID=A0A024S455_HYPJR|nr:hypothetical protein M419DRAFT_87451 [Trichoderma reesei RUT C-30]
MPPRPGTKQISKPPQRKSKLSSRGLQLAVDLNSASTASADSDKAYHAIISTTARATADSTTIASSPPFHGLTTSGSVPVPQSQAHTAQEGQFISANKHIPVINSASSTCTLLSPSHTNEASPSFTHAQGHPAIALAEPAPVFHTPCEGQNMGTINQTMSDQDGDVGMQRLDGGMPTPTPDMAPVAPPLHTAMFEAIDLMKTRIRQLEEGNVSATPTERARYGMLLGACHNMDPVFLILHQQYCCWMIDRRTAYARFPIQPTVIDVAFGELYNLFQDGERLSPPHRLWCSRYPGFSDDVVGLDRVYSQIKDFITVFAIKWPHALAAIQSKKVPLMAFQIRDWFLCTSPTIANTLFTYIRRVIGVPNGPLGVEINHLFNMDNCQERAFEEQKVSPEEMAGIRSTMLRSYLAVVQKARIQQASLAGWSRLFLMDSCTF